MPHLVEFVAMVVTVGKSRSGLPSLTTADDGHPDCLPPLLLSLIRSAKLRSPDCLFSLLLSVIRSALATSRPCQ